MPTANKGVLVKWCVLYVCLSVTVALLVLRVYR